MSRSTTPVELDLAAAEGSLAVDVRSISRRFGDVHALRDVSLRVERGEIHALLGPNGAGKTTLLRILSGLVEPETGDVEVLGVHWNDPPREAKRLFGLVPSGDRSFYLRISGLENLIFFARLYGIGLADARSRAEEALRAVDLQEAARRRVGTYSHGMQKRLSVARGLLMDPPLLFVDEATHDLDPEGARRIRALVTEASGRGVGVLWATQRIEEIRGFAQRVTVLHRGEVRFAGSVPELLAAVPPYRFLLQLRGGVDDGGTVSDRAKAILEGVAMVVGSQDARGEHTLIALHDGVTLGRALGILLHAGIEVLACREERSEIEEAFMQLIGTSEP
jgi:ABC-type multidrug transport system ATPase subunit